MTEQTVARDAMARSQNFLPTLEGRGDSYAVPRRVRWRMIGWCEGGMSWGDVDVGGIIYKVNVHDTNAMRLMTARSC